MNTQENPAVSVVIPVFNGERTIGRVLERVTAQEGCPPFEVVVVDDGSTDGTPAVVQKARGVRYIRQENQGPAAARNCGARAARGEWICFTDADCLPHPDWITRLVTGFQGDRVTAVMGSYGIANPESWLAGAIHAEILYRHRTLMSEAPQVFGSYNVCILRERFLALGGFDEAYRHASGEDNDLSYRMIEAGDQIRFAPEALVDHFHPVSVRRYLYEQARHGFWRAAMYLRHPARMRGDGYTFWKDGAEVVGCYLAAGFGLLGLWVPGAEWGGVILVVTGLAGEWVFCRKQFKLFNKNGLYFSMVLLARAVARGLGLGLGIVALIIQAVQGRGGLKKI